MSSPFVVSAKRPSRCLGYGHISRSAKRVDNHPRRELKSGVGRRSSPPAPILKHWLRNGVAILLRTRMPANARKLKEEALGARSVGSNRVSQLYALGCGAR